MRITLQNNNENTSQNNNSSETNNSQDDSTGKQPPKTGDPTSFASLYALAGSALAGIGASKIEIQGKENKFFLKVGYCHFGSTFFEQMFKIPIFKINRKNGKQLQMRLPLV